MTDEQEFDQPDEHAIAIVGIACRLPAAASPAAFWQNLRDGHESLTALDDEELLGTGVSEALLADPNYVKAGMFLEHMDCFDAGFFGFSPRDAAIMDPQHRLFLETCWEGLENAGYDPATFAGSIGVFAGSGHNAYLPYNLLSNPALVDDVGFFLLRHTGNDKDFLTTRVSYCFNLKGPSVNVQTACSTSLVAAHSACQSLLNGECDMALAGGVTIELPDRRGYLYKENEILSPDGHCRPFDAQADGTVFGSGGGVVVLRRLEDALEDGDNVQAIIRASAINNDGAGKVSYLAPSIDGQAAVVVEALELANIAPDTVSFIECHGTATKMGDPIEVEALNQAYGKGDIKPDNCALGSVKSNIGHLDTAAGVAGMIKVVQALKHRQLPPTLHYQSPNPAIDFSSTPFYVNNQLREWLSDGPRRAAISSLGVGGTNAHIILEEAPLRQSGEVREQQLLVLSARSKPALQEACARYAAHLSNTDQPLADIAYTAAVGRKAFPLRCCVAGATKAEIETALESNDNDKLFFDTAPEGRTDMVFMFAGGGSQYPNMGRDLYQREPAYRDALDECFTAAQALLDFDLPSLLFPEESQLVQAAADLERPSRALPALFSTQYAQAKLWRSWGVNARAYIGHSMGEYTAACLAGVFTARDALAIVAKRGQLFERLEPGAMLSVMLSEEELLSILGTNGQLSIAAVNGPELCVASGPEPAIADLTARLEQDDVACQRIHIAVAAHSAMLEPILDDFRRFLQTVHFQAPQVPVVSNLTGEWLTQEQAGDANYWVQHLRQTVRFSAGVSLLVKSTDRQLLLEVGPGTTLLSAARQHPNIGPNIPVLNSMRHAKQAGDDQGIMLTALGRLWGCGAVDDWQPIYSDQQRLRVELPTYPFEHQPYWIAPGQSVATVDTSRRKDIEQWFYQPAWQPSAVPGTPFEGSQLVVLFGRADGAFWRQLVTALQGQSLVLVEVTAAASYEAVDPTHYRLDPSSKDQYLRLFDAISKQKYDRVSLLHGWSLGQQDVTLERSFYPLLALAQAVGEQGWDDSSLCVLSSGAIAAGVGDVVHAPIAATMLGTCRVLPQEISGLSVRYIDVDACDEERSPQKNRAWLCSLMGSSLCAELICQTEWVNQTICYRAGQRLVEDYRTVSVPRAATPVPLRSDGCYLISGGLGGLGLQLARQLAEQQPGINLALLGRTPLPTKELWPTLQQRNSRDATRVRAIQALEDLGACVNVYAVDIADSAALSVTLEKMTNEQGPLRGIFHTAGVIKDNLLPLKTREECAAVLAPKIQGTLALAQSSEQYAPDFMVLYSSTSAIVGVAGQADYAAANAFLDAYAHHRRALDGLPVISVNWSAWQQVGMAAELAEGSRYQGLGFEEFAACFEESSYRRCLSSSDWLLDEHRTKAGMALVPGTGYLDIIRAAAEAGGLPGDGQVLEIRDVFFLAPLNIRDGEQRVVDITLTSNGAGTSFSLKSAFDPDAAATDQWLSEHVQGQLVTLSNDVPLPQPLDALLKRCQSSVIDNDGSVEHYHMDFGERWQCLRKIYFGDQEAVAELVLPERYAGDLTEFALHPALLDMITAAGFRLAPDYQPERDFFVPLSYGRVTLFQPLQGHVFGRVALTQSDEDRCCFDIDVLAPDGVVLATIGDFVAKRMVHDVLDREAQEMLAVSPLQQELETAIKPAEGRQLIGRFLSHPELAQLVISPLDFQHRFNQAGLARHSEQQQEQALPESDRPELQTDYIAAQTNAEKLLAGMWQSALGIGSIGVEDNFFELGGHSLMLTQLVGKAKKQLGIQVSLSKLFDKPTIRHWLSLAESAVDVEQKPKPAAIKRVSRDDFKTKR